MNHRFATLAALAMIGTSALGLEALAISRVARGTTAWLGSPEALALGRAGRIAAESLGGAAADHARQIALDATLGVVRGLGAVYAATGSPTVAVPAPPHHPRVVIIRELKPGAAHVNADVNSGSCCESRTADRTTS